MTYLTMNKAIKEMVRLQKRARRKEKGQDEFEVGEDNEDAEDGWVGLLEAMPKMPITLARHALSDPE